MKDVEKVLVPIDFSDNSRKIVKAAADVAKRFEARLVLIFVVQSLEDYSGFFVPHLPLEQLADEMLIGAEKKMANFIEDNLGDDAQVESKVIAGDVAAEIVAFAETCDAGMIVMGTHGYKGIERMLFGSVAENIIKNAPCPVLTINPYKHTRV